MGRMSDLDIERQEASDESDEQKDYDELQINSKTLRLPRRKSDYVKKESEFGYIGHQTKEERFARYAGRTYRNNGDVKPLVPIKDIK